MPTPGPPSILFSLCLHHGLQVSCFLYAHTMASQYLVFFMPTPWPPMSLFSLSLHHGLTIYWFFMPTPGPPSSLFSFCLHQGLSEACFFCLHQGLTVACFIYASTRVCHNHVVIVHKQGPPNILFSLCLHLGLTVYCFIYAYTRASQCGKCEAKFYVEGQEIDCAMPAKGMKSHVYIFFVLY